MKYSILGFKQDLICQLSQEKGINIDANDLLILQDLADFMNRKSIIKYSINDNFYFSITYNAIIEDLPILNIKKQALRDRIDKLCSLGIIEKQIVKNETGSWTAFRLSELYESLKYGLEKEGGVYQTTHGGCVSNYTPNNNTTILSNNNNKKENSEKEKIDAFVEKIYKMYPAKCPMRNISLGKTKKDKERIEKLLKFYSMEDIEKVVKHEIDEKYGKAYMSNFSTFLNNFPDPQSLFGDNSTNVESTNTNNNEKEVVINGQLYR